MASLGEQAVEPAAAHWLRLKHPPQSPRTPPYPCQAYSCIDCALCAPQEFVLQTMRFSFIATLVVLTSAVPTSYLGDLDHRIESLWSKLQELRMEKDTVVERMTLEHTRE